MLNKKNQTIVKTVSYILLIIIAIYCVFPFIWMVISAFKPKDEIRTAIPSFVIHAPTLENFKKVLFQAGFINYIKNSFIVSVIACGLSMVIAVMAGYALSRYYKQKLVKVSNFAMMLSQMIPGVLLLVIYDHAEIPYSGNLPLSDSGIYNFRYTAVYVYDEQFLRYCTDGTGRGG